MKFLKLLLRHGCAHRFSWPRIGDNGCNYQICLTCGTAYEYDWTVMRRTSRLLVQPSNTNLRSARIAQA